MSGMPTKAAEGKKQISGHGLAYQIDGRCDAPPLVLINSLGMTTVLWDGIAPDYARHFLTIRYDQRGHGASTADPVPRSVADLGADLIALLDDLGIGRVSICGLSLGGLVAMWVAANAPDRVDRLVLACTSAHPNDEAKWVARVDQVLSHGVASVTPQGSQGWFTAAFAASHPDLMAKLRREVELASAVAYAGCCEALRTANLLPLLPKISAPTLIIVGGHDRSFPIAHANAIHHGIADSRVVLFDDAAHIACVEIPERFAQASLDHLLGKR